MKQKLSVNLKTSEDSTPLKINQNRCKSCQCHSKGWKECWGIAFPLSQQCCFPAPQTEQSVCVCGYSSLQTRTATLKTNGTPLWARWNTFNEKGKRQCCGRACLHCCTTSGWGREKVNLWTGCGFLPTSTSLWISVAFTLGANDSIFLLTRINLR